MSNYHRPTDRQETYFGINTLTLWTVAPVQAGQLAVDARSLQGAGGRAAADALSVPQSERTPSLCSQRHHNVLLQLTAHVFNAMKLQ